ncbi:hypothetical protein HSB1_20910 [Halogranum salarium B-1]|uniref:Uncharacterized protein n=1 Tax=Halogranum salarium B-1 TaxID=1210908 RepID=J3A3H1_9EURY|nr:hypothetical protein HSB1_20910 [Halogranum salarium B-1]
MSRNESSERRCGRPVATTLQSGSSRTVSEWCRTVSERCRIVLE